MPARPNAHFDHSSRLSCNQNHVPKWSSNHLLKPFFVCVRSGVREAAIACMS